MSCALLCFTRRNSPSSFLSAHEPLLAEDFNNAIGLAYPERAATIIGSGLYDPSLYSGDDATRLALTDVGTDFSW